MNNDWNLNEQDLPKDASAPEEPAATSADDAAETVSQPADTAQAAAVATENGEAAPAAEPASDTTANETAQAATAAPNAQRVGPAPGSYTYVPPCRPYGGQPDGIPTPPPRQASPYGYTAPPPYHPQNGAPYQGASPYTMPVSPIMSTPQKKGEASKGFVIGAVAIGMVMSLLIGFLFGSLGGSGTATLGGGTVIVQHASKSETPVITDKGDAAYAASIAAQTVVEVSVEMVTTDSYYGKYVTQSAGSGVIVSSTEDGTYILTCAHVIEDATNVSVKLKDGTEYKASAFSGDSQSDVGIIKIDVKGLPTATLANFDEVVVGEEVVAIGNALGKLAGSVTNGIVSALERKVVVDGTTYNLLQTNVAINPGNSGGGLFNMKGELIGIVNAKSTGENIEGLAYAIPIDDAEAVMTQLIENGYVTGRVKLGFSLIEIQSMTDAQYWWRYSEYFSDYGIYIIESEDSQFKTGDRLLAINGNNVGSLSELKAVLQNLKVGDTVKVTISRKNATTDKFEMHDFNLVLTEKTA